MTQTNTRPNNSSTSGSGTKGLCGSPTITSSKKRRFEDDPRIHPQITIQVGPAWKSMAFSFSSKDLLWQTALLDQMENIPSDQVLSTIHMAREDPAIFKKFHSWIERGVVCFSDVLTIGKTHELGLRIGAKGFSKHVSERLILDLDARLSLHRPPYGTPKEATDFYMTTHRNSPLRKLFVDYFLSRKFCTVGARDDYPLEFLLDRWSSRLDFDLHRLNLKQRAGWAVSPSGANRGNLDCRVEISPWALNRQVQELLGAKTERKAVTSLTPPSNSTHPSNLIRE